MLRLLTLASVAGIAAGVNAKCDHLTNGLTCPANTAVSFLFWLPLLPNADC